MPDFSDFDARGYRTVDVRSGYAEWVPTYERTVEDAMDLALLEALASVPWKSLGRRPTSAAGQDARAPGCGSAVFRRSTAST